MEDQEQIFRQMTSDDWDSQLVLDASQVHIHLFWEWCGALCTYLPWVHLQFGGQTTQTGSPKNDRRESPVWLWRLLLNHKIWTIRNSVRYGFELAFYLVFSSLYNA